ncbi:hypothetical protein BCR35DRAFT_317057 [Leucosporidium creatinivorum]|uniref:FAD-binding domain-containing protein n=1 Tax=Leucosporidium creatinivorum TaxID=106004 RepID=A0A1Y2G0A4_9BASI|nr:hypothetical protein BCR35DRAFT_317057 [Leucosporidium creatinivorum]
MSDSERLKIIIIGAGIAGLAAATALRAEHQVLVLESSRLKQEVGAAIHLGPNASKIAIERWGMDLTRLNSPEVAWYTEYTQQGEPQIKAQIDTRRDFGAPWLLNHRVDLHQELRRLATDAEGPGAPATVRTGARVLSVDGDEGTVTLGDGEILKADVLVGADGIHSIARTAVLGYDLVAKRSGHSAYRMLIPREKVIEDPELSFLVDGTSLGITTFVSHDRRVVAYPCRGSTRPELLNIVAIVPDRALEAGSTESWSAEGSVAELVASFSSFAPKLRPSCGLWQLRDQDPLHSWTRGRLIIIGDASHAMLPHQGQGGGQSVEDAEALGALLSGLTRAQSSRIPQRLQLVESVRIERASKIQGYSREKALGAKDGNTFTLNAGEFSAYNYSYFGALDWARKLGIEVDGLEGGGKEQVAGRDGDEKEPSEAPVRQALASLVAASG